MLKRTRGATRGDAAIGVRAKKSLGQNFLMHQQTAARIADAAHLTVSDVVLEIGPGTGMLTRELLARAGKVIAVEADNELFQKLENEHAPDTEEGRLELIHADIREWALDTLPAGYALVANIPYYITGEILRTFLTARNKPSSMTLLVQKEVAERIVRSKKESLLSLSVKAYGTPAIVFKVPRGAFVPAPNVDSAVLRISGIRTDAFSSPEAEERFFEILRAGFSQKRKRLMKNLEQISSVETLKPAFSDLGLSENVRAEDVPLPVWQELTEKLTT